MAEEIANNRASEANAARGPHKGVPVDTPNAMTPVTVTKSVGGKKRSGKSVSDRRASSEVDVDASSIRLNQPTRETLNKGDNVPAERSNSLISVPQNRRVRTIQH